MARWLAATALLVTALSAVGCKSSTSPNPDGAVAKDMAGGDSSNVCPNDDGVRNKAKGQACTCNPQCSTGFCADGFCCDKACGETCMSCGLPTSLGTCTLTPAGVKPRVASQCPTTPVSSCGLDGTCDGAGACRKYEAGSICMAGKCDGDAVTNNYACDGNGACKLTASTVCAPFSCNGATNLCYPTCSSDADCVSGRKCVNQSCGKKMNGALCPMGNSECASGFCADGVCCNTACGGACRSCNLVGLLGTCSPVSAGKGHPMCTQEASRTCGTTGVCDGFGTCSLYPAATLCEPSSCVGTTAMNTVRSCDGLGACQPGEVQSCGKYRCANGACNSKCTVNADCADGVACMNGSCGLKLDGQKCAANAECQNQNCVDGYCCNTACTGACRSCALAGSLGKCMLAAAGAADPRATCKDMLASSCGTDGKCDGTGACRKYPAGTTVCAAETCVADVYTGPSTCNASGQCIKPNATACFPYHCNATKCFAACTTTADCVMPNICGMNGMISSCGLKPNGGACSVGTECASSFCAQGVCCNSACGNACQACNLAGTVGSCTNVASGVDPQGKCAVQAQTTCGTTGQCAAGQCARWAAGSQCVAASCPTASTRAPASQCNGAGACVTPAVMNCAPGRCSNTACVNTCTTNADCTAPATCVAGSCGLQGKGGSCTATSMCAAGLTCYLSEGSPGVCCDSACAGTCESCKLAGLVGTCSAIPAGMTDPDPATACVAAADPTTCGLNGRCAGNNTTTNSTGTARCQFLTGSQGCRSRSCTAGTATTAATETQAASCSGSGTCPSVVSVSCAPYNKCTGPNVQCATSCASDADCVGSACLSTGRCNAKLPNGSLCTTLTAGDCISGNCVDGVCCNSACAGECQTCNLPGGSPGTCSNRPVGTTCSDDGNACNGTNSCNAAGACAIGAPPSVDDGNPCTVDSCGPTGIVHVPGNANEVCRGAAGDCDAPELCSGTSANCPGNDRKPAGTPCRASVGACDVAETCNGSSPNCPGDSFVAAGMACRAAAGMCDVAETCSGASGVCPADAFTSGGVCRASNGVCDVAESCSGASANCPPDAFATSGMCRASNGVCDVPESCSGASANCPADVFATSGMCRASNGVCDVPESCSGASANCPADVFAGTATQCRAAVAGGCDVAENCSGTAASCPTDAFVAAGTQCRAAAGVCDVAEACTGTATCPSDALAPPGAACPSDGMECTLDMCNGTSATCPYSPVTEPTPCNGGMGMCTSGACITPPPM